MSNQQYDFKETLQYLDAGIFDEKVSRAMRDVALAVVTHGDNGKKGTITLEFKMQRIGESMQIHMDHKLKYDKPTAKGKVVEENTTSTPLYITTKGNLSFLPNDQVDAFGHELSKE